MRADREAPRSGTSATVSAVIVSDASALSRTPADEVTTQPTATAGLNGDSPASVPPAAAITASAADHHRIPAAGAQPDDPGDRGDGEGDGDRDAVGARQPRVRWANGTVTSTISSTRTRTAAIAGGGFAEPPGMRRPGGLPACGDGAEAQLNGIRRSRESAPAARVDAGWTPRLHPPPMASTRPGPGVEPWADARADATISSVALVNTSPLRSPDGRERPDPEPRRRTAGSGRDAYPGVASRSMTVVTELDLPEIDYNLPGFGPDTYHGYSARRVSGTGWRTRRWRTSCLTPSRATSSCGHGRRRSPAGRSPSCSASPAARCTRTSRTTSSTSPATSTVGCGR